MGYMTAITQHTTRQCNTAQGAVPVARQLSQLTDEAHAISGNSPNSATPQTLPTAETLRDLIHGNENKATSCQIRKKNIPSISFHSE